MRRCGWLCGTLAVAAAVMAGPVQAQFGGMGGGMEGMGGGMGGMGAMGGFAGVVETHYEPLPADSAVAEQAREALDAVVELPQQEVTLAALPELVRSVAEVPMLLDQRALAEAEVEPSKQLSLGDGKRPLRTVLRQSLEPLGLQAIVEDEGLVVTLDPTALARQGKSTSQWITIEDESARQIDRQLDNVTSLNFFDVPLADALRQISTDNGITLILDVRELEDIGLSPDLPVTVELKDVRLRTALELMLGRADLTYINRGEFLSITTEEAAEANLLARIYWLDGIGVPDMSQMMQTIEQHTDVDNWEALGGPATMTPLRTQHRRALVVSATTPMHHDIEKLLAALRQQHFAGDAQFERVETVQPGGMGGGGMGGGGMGGGGMGGGGMF